MFLLLALLPLLIAVFLLLVLQWNVCDASWTTLGMTVMLASLVSVFHRTPWQIALALGEGSATMVTAGVILLPALIFYQMQQETGAIALLTRGLASIVPDRDLQTLLLVLGVGPCLEALCGSGFGAVALLPLLVGLHGNRLKALQLSVLSQIMVAWGSLGLGTTLAAHLAGLPVGMLSMYTAFLLFPSTIGFSLLVLLLSGGWNVLQRYWCVATLAGSLLMLVICLCSQFLMIEVSGALASLCVIALLLVWGRHLHPHPSDLSREYANTSERTPFLSALLPYLFLIAGIFTSRVWPLATLWLQTHIVLVYPVLKLHLALLYSPGLWLLLAALLHIPLFSLRTRHLVHIHVRIWRRFLPTIITMVNFLWIAALMQDSGMIDTLGRAAALLGENYIWVASLVGAIGGWLTNSILGGNTLTIHMQMEVGTRIGVPAPWLIAAQNASAAMASAISPARMILLSTAGGLLGKEGLLLRKLGPMILWSLVLTTLLLVWFTSSALLGGAMVLLVLLVIVNIPLILAAFNS